VDQAGTQAAHQGAGPPNVGDQIAFEAMATGSAVGLVAERLVFSPQHLRLWGLGTVVNVG
jgi:hypothetical protein